MIHPTRPQLATDLAWKADELAFFRRYQNAKRSDFFAISKKTHPHVIHQIFSRQIAKDKLPSFYDHIEIVYPPSLNLEQCSSETAAQFKASLFSGNQFIDLSGGFGIDAFFLAQQFTSGIIVERNSDLLRIASHNFSLLQQKNVVFIHADANDFIRSFEGSVDLIYIDPARRNQSGQKLISFSDCDPEILQLLPKLLKKTNNLLIKASPLLDIQSACTALKNVKQVFVVAIDNECKELLFHIEKNYNDDVSINAVNLEKGKQAQFSYTRSDEMSMTSRIGETKKYLYEPNAAIMKSGGFKSVSKAWSIDKLHVNTHLYTADTFIPHFPGRKFEVLKQVKADKKIIQQLLPEQKANVSIRNFPGSVKALKDKLGLHDGGDFYVFGCTNHLNQKIIIIAKKTDQGIHPVV